jgi:hypothetical protein
MRILLSTLLVLAACGNTGQPLVSYPAFATGAGAGEAFTVDGWEVRLERGAMAIGPIYFCATEAASADLCRTAVNELADVVAFDPLSSTPQALGSVGGSAGTLRSVTYDLGITWYPRQGVATAAPAAPDGHSALFGGYAAKADRSVVFSVELDLAPTYAGTLLVEGQRVGPMSVDARTARLDVDVDPRVWFGALDFDDLAAQGDVAVIEPGTRAYNALAISAAVSAPPTFRWTTTPEKVP